MMAKTQLPAEHQMVLDSLTGASRPQSRREIARATNLPMPMVCRCVREMLDAGLLHDAGNAPDHAIGDVQQLISPIRRRPICPRLAAYRECRRLREQADSL